MTINQIVIEDRGTFLVLVSSERYLAILSTTNSLENVQASHVLESLRQLGNELVWEDLQQIKIN